MACLEVWNSAIFKNLGFKSSGLQCCVGAWICVTSIGFAILSLGFERLTVPHQRSGVKDFCSWGISLKRYCLFQVFFAVSPYVYCAPSVRFRGRDSGGLISPAFLHFKFNLCSLEGDYMTYIVVPDIFDEKSTKPEI